MPSYSPGRAYRGKRSGVPANVDSRWADALQEYLGGKNLDLSRVGAASWQNDPYAYLCGIIPNKGQQEMLDATAPGTVVQECGYGGDKGGGKTVGVILRCNEYLLAHPGYRILWVRKRKKALDDSVIDPWKELLRRLEASHGLRWKFTSVDGVMKLILFTDTESDRISTVTFSQGVDTATFQGGNFDMVVLDEGPEVDRRVYDELIARCRGSINNPKRTDGTDGRQWKVLFIWMGNQKKGFLFNEYVKRKLKGQLRRAPYEHREFVFCAVADNLHNLDATYLKRRRLQGVNSRIEAETSGAYDFEDTLVFPKFHDETFCEFDPLKMMPQFHRMCDVPGVGGYDYGYTHDCAILWGFLFGDFLWIYDEFVETGTGPTQQIGFMRQYPRTSAWWADRSVQFQRGKTLRATPEQDFLVAGVVLTPANVNEYSAVERGVGMVRDYLERGLIRIHQSRCPKLVEALTSWEFETEDTTGDVKPGEYQEEFKDACDALRYLVIREADRIGMRARIESRLVGRSPTRSADGPGGIDLRRARAVVLPKMSERQKQQQTGLAKLGRAVIVFAPKRH